MSLNSLATTSVAREVASRDGVRKLSRSSDDAVGPKEEDVQNALSALVEYVPAETITLYLATISVLPVLTTFVPSLNALNVYVIFAVSTPVLFSLIYAGKRRAANMSRWPGRKLFPWWPFFAAMFAFLAWGLAIPDGPLGNTAEGRALGAFIAIVASTLLGVLGRFFAPKAATK